MSGDFHGADVKALQEQLAAKDAEIARLKEALIEVGDFLADDCVENYPFDRIPGSFADEADRLLKLIKASVGHAPAIVALKGEEGK